MIEGLKPIYNSILKPAVGLFQRLHIRPNHITIAGTIIYCGAAYLAAVGKWHWALALVILGSVFDGWDGLLAREANLKSTFGAILDSCCDRITEIVLLLGILYYYVHHPVNSHWALYLTFAALSGSLMVSYVKARCVGAGLPCKGGLFQMPERIVILCFGLLTGPRIMFWVLLLLAVLTWVTVAQRLIIAYRESRKKSV
jgi:CDP-diacylglycerol---glycerol-3-phosphate 3-phosphatidyltransferase